MGSKYKSSLKFWGIVFSVLLFIPAALLLDNTSASNFYLRALPFILAVVFGPGVPIYLGYKGYKYYTAAGHQKTNKVLLLIGLIIMAAIGIIWLSMVIVAFMHPEVGGAGLVLIIFPLLLIGAVGEKCAKSASIA